MKKIITNHARSNFYYFSILLFYSGYCNSPSLFSQDFNFSKEYFSDPVRGFGYVGDLDHFTFGIYSIVLPGIVKISLSMRIKYTKYPTLPKIRYPGRHTKTEILGILAY